MDLHIFQFLNSREARYKLDSKELELRNKLGSEKHQSCTLIAPKSEEMLSLHLGSLELMLYIKN